MKKFAAALLCFLALGPASSAEIGSLSHVFLAGRTLLDDDGDSFPDKIALCVIIPDAPNAKEVAAAADIAARANFESLALDFNLVKRESEAGRMDRLENPVFLGVNGKWLREAIKSGDVAVPVLGPHQGFVSVFASGSKTGLFVVASTEDDLLLTARAFFLRWPYFWDIWGRQEGHTYATLERDVGVFLEAKGLNLQRTIIKSALYDFPPPPKGPSPLRKLAWNAGEIANLTVEIHFTDENDLAAAAGAFEDLRLLRLQGKQSETLSYPGCAAISVGLRFGKKSRDVVLPRQGYPKRMLTASYKDAPRAESLSREFDLAGLFTPRGLYTDADRDGIADGFDARIIIPESSAPRAVTALASRCMLDTAGATFPIVALDREVESRKILRTPLLVGPNTLTQELLRLGKLVPPPLQTGQGLAAVVPRAFNASAALVVLGADSGGLEKTLDYLARTFPGFDTFSPGHPRLDDVPADLERFLKGQHGAAEAYLLGALRKTADELRHDRLDALTAEIVLPKPNPRFEEEVRKVLGTAARSCEIRPAFLTEGRKVFEKERTFPWEADRALELLRENLKVSSGQAGALRVSLGLSESAEVRLRLKKQIEALCLQEFQAAAEVDVASSYKQGFFWLAEKVAAALKGKAVVRLVIRFAPEIEDFRRPKRFYSEPSRWLQELYPADEILARELSLAPDKIVFEMNPGAAETYEVAAYDGENAVVFRQSFSPRTKEMTYLKLLPEWGTVKLTTGWVRIERGPAVVFDSPLPSDLEMLWAFFQDEALAPAYAHIMKKTGNAPVFSKQPFFKQLRVEIWASEPDARIGLDEEAVSSLEALHDEIYFDTLDLLRGITDLDVETAELPEDTQRYSAPGNVLPVIHASAEGEAPRIKVTFEDRPADAPEILLKWNEPGRGETSRRLAFPSFKSRPVLLPSLVYDGLGERIESLTAEIELEKETDYPAFLDLLPSYRELLEREALPTALSYPRLASLRLRIKGREGTKEETFPLVPWSSPSPVRAAAPKPGQAIVPTDRILSPEMVQDITRRLARFPALRTWTAGQSYEGRDVPVIEAYRPAGAYVSIPRLIALKPTLYLSGRQHANEVSSTTYILRLAELLATDITYGETLAKVNFVLHPLENPDGAALAFDLQKLTPLHSLHAGRYGSLGIDIGVMSGSSRPILPEARVRRDLQAKWSPDIYLNLHGYPSHEWVQPFSGYSPYLFRDYWIPKGWFTYYRTLNLSIDFRYKEAGDELRSFIIKEMNADPKIRESNRKFYDRYARWAWQWQPHLNPLELWDGVNIYAKRRGGTESRLTPRAQTTYAEETPELMDETATGAWLDFLSAQGLAYLRAHIKYLSQARFETARIDEEAGSDRVRIQFVRARPGSAKKNEKQ